MFGGVVTCMFFFKKLQRIPKILHQSSSFLSPSSNSIQGLVKFLGLFWWYILWWEQKQTFRMTSGSQIFSQPIVGHPVCMWFRRNSILDIIQLVPVIKSQLVTLPPTYRWQVNRSVEMMIIIHHQYCCWHWLYHVKMPKCSSSSPPIHDDEYTVVL